MFEDSTFESMGRITTRSRGWMIATFTFNGAILLALVLIPLIYPEALPRQMIAFLMETPVPPAVEKPQPAQQLHAAPMESEIHEGQIFAPPLIPSIISIVGKPEAPPESETAAWDPGSGMANGDESIFRKQGAAPVVRPETRGPVHVSSTIVAGLLVQKTIPAYPAIPREAGIQGTVVLQATISKNGTIENLRVVSGPAMLQQSALDAVKTWRYRPYLLNGEPVEVETTVNVVFTMGR